MVRWAAPFCVTLAPGAFAQRTSSPFDPPSAVGLLQRADIDLAFGKVTPSPFSLFRWGPVQVHPHVDGGVTYGDGINSGPGVQQKTYTYRVSPGVMFQLGPRWTLDYTPALTYYSNKAFEDDLSHYVSLNGGTTYGDWSFGFSQSYSISLPTVDELARQTTIETFNTSLNASYYFNSKWMLQSTLNQDLRSSDEFNSSKSWSIDEFVNYQLAPSLSFGLGIGVGYERVDTGSDMLHETPQAKVDLVISEKVNFDVHGGGEIRQFLSSDLNGLITPVYGAAIQYRPFKVTTFSLSGEQSVQGSLFDNQITESSDLSMGLSQRLLGAVILSVSGGIGATTYHSSSAGLIVNRQDDYWNFQTSLSYSFFKNSSSSIFYQYRNYNSNQPGFGYATSQVGINLGYRF